MCRIVQLELFLSRVVFGETTFNLFKGFGLFSLRVVVLGKTIAKLLKGFDEVWSSSSKCWFLACLLLVSCCFQNVGFVLFSGMFSGMFSNVGFMPFSGISFVLFSGLFSNVGFMLFSGVFVMLLVALGFWFCIAES
jgi:hypothetical protein